MIEILGPRLRQMELTDIGISRSQHWVDFARRVSTSNAYRVYREALNDSIGFVIVGGDFNVDKYLSKPFDFVLDEMKVIAMICKI